ncbi:MAG: hypothetical protein J5733_05035 [Bacteroidaceae bacterium]|nr:hypothetical protein [Bacteroidaceae bacterium]
MSKKIRSFWRLALGSLITLLGFTACKTTKKAQRGDDVVELYAPPPGVIEKQTPIDKVRVLYAVPPVRVVHEPK